MPFNCTMLKHRRLCNKFPPNSTTVQIPLSILSLDVRAWPIYSTNSRQVKCLICSINHAIKNISRVSSRHRSHWKRDGYLLCGPFVAYRGSNSNSIDSHSNNLNRIVYSNLLASSYISVLKNSFSYRTCRYAYLLGNHTKYDLSR